MLTKSYYKDTENVIVNSDVDYETKKECLNALRAIYKQDQIGVIDPVEFGERFMPEDLRKDYSANVLSQPKYERKFTRNLALMGRELTKRVLRFRNKIVVQAPEDNFEDNVKVITSIQEAEQIIKDPQSTLLKINGTPYHQ